MKVFFVSSLFLIVVAASVAPAALARCQDADLNGDGVVTLQEKRLCYLDNSSN